VNFSEGIPVINEMQADGIIERYAIGGDAATSLYLDSVNPRHLEIVVPLPTVPGKLIVSPTRIFEYLIGRGAIFEAQFMRIGDTKTLFVPPSTPLLEEALRDAPVRDFDGHPAKVFTADHLAALAFQTGRANARVLDLAAADVLDVDRLHAILARHGLMDRWKQFLRNQR
jgi:hypothetical protein